MRLRWLALAWLVGIVVADSVCQSLGITQPIAHQQTITAAILPYPMPTSTILALLHTALLTIALLGIGVALLLAISSRRTATTIHARTRIATMITIALSLASAALGGMRYQANLALTTPHSIWLLADMGEVIVQGNIVRDPQRTDDGQQIILATQAVQFNGKVIVVEGLILVKLPSYPIYHYGDQAIVQGRIRLPPLPKREGTFDYRAYLARQHIFAMMQEPAIVPLIDTTGNPILKGLLAFRDHCHAILLRELPEPQASIAIGLLLGLKAAIPKTVYATFSTVGTSHLLVISGWHLTIVASVFAGMSKRLHFNQQATFWLLIVGIWLYTLFVGMSDSVLRAAIMASLTVLAQTTQRKTEPWTLLATACLVLTLHNPQTLWNIGFQLSALATASLFAFATPITQRLQQWLHTDQLQQRYGIPIKWLIEPLAITLAAQVLVLPVILYHLGNLSLIAPLANMLLVPVLPYAMLTSAIALGVGLIWLPAGQFVATLFAWLPLAWLTEGANLLARVPWAALMLPRIPLWFVVSYYVIMVWWLRERSISHNLIRAQQTSARQTTANYQTSVGAKKAQR